VCGLPAGWFCGRGRGGMGGRRGGLWCRLDGVGICGDAFRCCMFKDCISRRFRVLDVLGFCCLVIQGCCATEHGTGRCQSPGRSHPMLSGEPLLVARDDALCACVFIVFDIREWSDPLLRPHTDIPKRRYKRR
jgi:hypothetical protein